MSKARPLCRCCGGPIAKRFIYINFGQSRASRPYETLEYRTERPTTKDEAARFSNHRMVSHRTHYDPAHPYVASITVWDGESYRDDHFCKNLCAERFGRMAATAIPDLQTEAYAAALKARRP